MILVCAIWLLIGSLFENVLEHLAFSEHLLNGRENQASKVKTMLLLDATSRLDG